MIATVIHAHNHPTRLVVAARSGACVNIDALTTFAPDYEAARAEAQRLYPNRTIVIPRLGELS